jgi:hypothetical protein
MNTTPAHSARIPMNVLRDIQMGVSNVGTAPGVLAASGGTHLDRFLAYCSDSTRQYFREHPDQKALVDKLTGETIVIDDPKSGANPLLKSGGMKCWACRTGAWAGIVVALAGVIAVTQGAAVAPLIAMDVGLIPVFAAIFGISDAAMATIAGAAGMTLGGLVIAGCEAAGCC